MSHLIHASTHIYDNTASGLTATTTQAAVDEIEARIVDIATVETSGGNFTSLATAMSTEAEGQTIAIGEGTFAETASIEPKTGQQIIGSGIDRTIITMTGNEVLFPADSIAGAGTISITSSAVTGAGANLTSFAVGDIISYNGAMYTLATITDANTATIEEHVGTTSGAFSPFFGLDVSDMVFDVTFTDMTIQAITTAFGWLIRMDTTFRTRFKRVKFEGEFNVTQGLFRAIGCVDVVFEDCIFLTSDNRAFRHENRNQNMKFQNCQFISQGTGSTDDDHEILRSTQYEFNNCLFAGGEGTAILTGTGPVTGLKIVDCEFKNKGQHPIEFNTTTASLTNIDGLVSGCHFKDNGGNGVYINSGGSIRVIGNIIDNQAIDGVQIDNDAANVNITVNDNYIDNCTIGIDNDSATAAILIATGNHLAGNGTDITDAGSGNVVANNL